MRTALGAALLLLLAGCGRGEFVGEDKGVTENQIERLSTPEVEPASDASASARLQPLRPSDPIGEVASGGCDFSANGRMVMVSTATDSVARVNGELLHLVHAAPIDGTGGFFEDRQISISVGRVGQAGADRGAGRWPARISVTNRRTRAQTRLDGFWRCEPLIEQP